MSALRQILSNTFFILSLDSNMTHQSPIYVSSNGSSGVGPMADELEISMLLTPHGHTFYSDDVFSQDEFDSLEAVVLNRFVHYCKTNQPKDYNDHDARVHTYIQILITLIPQPTAFHPVLPTRRILQDFGP
ncbi:hypothetical protein PGT21_009037 [Puccinia graminis f. sp. tritici]|uniref:Uncharacterized protein n=1 Tax=Puccinia graminis f. sp. tritici TaxID=56615 RepID=A0A5B0MN53_PUCGR|nr:hypothetical protein PGT21_009037 [Puccinia graminis f. sp. tritici]